MPAKEIAAWIINATPVYFALQAFFQAIVLIDLYLKRSAIEALLGGFIHLINSLACNRRGSF